MEQQQYLQKTCKKMLSYLCPTMHFSWKRQVSIKIQGKTYLGKAEILIGKHSPDGWKFNDVQLNKITLHEIGHAIGILGHSENINDIMYYSTDMKRQSTLSSKDIETVNKIYGF